MRKSAIAAMRPPLRDESNSATRLGSRFRFAAKAAAEEEAGEFGAPAQTLELADLWSEAQRAWGCRETVICRQSSELAGSGPPGRRELASKNYDG